MFGRGFCGCFLPVISELPEACLWIANSHQLKMINKCLLTSLTWSLVPLFVGFFCNKFGCLIFRFRKKRKLIIFRTTPLICIMFDVAQRIDSYGFTRVIHLRYPPHSNVEIRSKMQQVTIRNPVALSSSSSNLVRPKWDSPDTSGHLISVLAMKTKAELSWLNLAGLQSP